MFPFSEVDQRCRTGWATRIGVEFLKALSFLFEFHVLRAEIGKKINSFEAEIAWNLDESSTSMLEPRSISAGLKARNEMRVDHVEGPPRRNA